MMAADTTPHQITGSSPSTYSIPGSLGRLDQLGPTPTQTQTHTPTQPSNNPYVTHTEKSTEALQFADISHSSTIDGTTRYVPSSDSSALLQSESSYMPSDAYPPAQDAPSSSSSSSSIDPDAHLTASFYQIKYYQRFFDVTTESMLIRLLKAMFPFQFGGLTGGRFYAEEGMKPDLYGPIWITTTLIFLLAAAGNYANYLQFIAQDTKPKWTCDYQKVTMAASVFYFWISLFPTAVWCFMQRYGEQKGLVEVISIFGYSLITLLPVCLLSIPPINILRWVSLSISLFISSVFLFRNLIHDSSNKTLWPMMGFVLLCNVGLGALTKFYFFD